MSKIADTNKKIEDKVINSYKTIEKTVVGGYKKIEDKFIDTFLRREGETTEEAKSRILISQAEAKAKQEEIAKQRQPYTKATEEIQKEIKEKYHN